MMKTVSKWIGIGALLLPLASHASIFSFNAILNSANELHTLVFPSSASGTATLTYNDNGTATLTDDTYSFAMSVFNLTGGPDGKAASMYHIHGAASTSQTATVRVALDAAPFIALNAGSTLLVGGNNVAAPTGLFSNGPYTNLSLLDMLKGGLAYVNVHTTANTAGEVRGQLLQVTVVPEPETYGMLLAGIALIGTVVRRRKSKT